MSLSRRLRNIAIGQINALKERLDRIDEEEAQQHLERRAQRDALKELNDPADIRPALRTPEEVASGRPAASAKQPTTTGPEMATGAVPASALSTHYRILGVPEGSDLETVEAAYNKLANRCAPDRFPEGSEEQQAAKEIFKRVDVAYNALRDTLDPTCGRFDKLEL